MGLLQPKRRRSSAQPALGGTSRRAAAASVDVTLVEESEEEELPAKKVGRSRKTVSGMTMKSFLLHPHHMFSQPPALNPAVYPMSSVMLVLTCPCTNLLIVWRRKRMGG
jgi:hypothetical protein